MKYLFLALIALYSKLISPALKNILGASSFCRFSPSCSTFAKEAIEKYGIVKGGSMFLRRFIKCQPFYSPRKNLSWKRA